jgi:hypothetical protein
MALKVYTYGDRDFQFDDSDVPKGAVLKEAVAPKNKARKADNKSVELPIEPVEKATEPVEKATEPTGDSDK